MSLADYQPWTMEEKVLVELMVDGTKWKVVLPYVAAADADSLIESAVVAANINVYKRKNGYG